MLTLQDTKTRYLSDYLVISAIAISTKQTMSDFEPELCEILVSHFVYGALGALHFAE